MFIRTALALILTAFAATAQAQLRPLAERAVPLQEVKILQNDGTTMVAFVPVRTNDRSEALVIMTKMREAAASVKVCGGSCTKAEAMKVEKYLRRSDVSVVKVEVR